ncbi:hypothetical protein E2C01_100799 [Portunus trituberculatus]|uniref:Uncharacterized protein n=1 Tax=Portunus trituberculatus TaxID=210409 RepID=A0A5B7KKF6_PORTR|nr:hypothetical protein [Portunus trituberculatus]
MRLQLRMLIRSVANTANTRQGDPIKALAATSPSALKRRTVKIQTHINIIRERFSLSLWDAKLSSNLRNPPVKIRYILPHWLSYTSQDIFLRAMMLAYVTCRVYK